MKTLVIGGAGFIGMHTAKRLLEHGHQVVSLGNLNDHYEPKLKQYRLAQLTSFENLTFVEIDLAGRKEIAELFVTEQTGVVYD